MSAKPTDAQREGMELLPCPFCNCAMPADGGHEDDCYFTLGAAMRAAPPGDVSLAPAMLAAWNRRASPVEHLLRQAAEALECNAMWAEGSEAHPRLLRVAAALRQRMGGTK